MAQLSLRIYKFLETSRRNRDKGDRMQTAYRRFPLGGTRKIENQTIVMKTYERSVTTIIVLRFGLIVFQMRKNLFIHEKALSTAN